MASRGSPRKPKANFLEAKGHRLTTDGKATPRSSRTSKSTSPADLSVIDEVSSINRHLVSQIETLRLKIEVDQRQHSKSMTSLVTDCDKKLRTRELEIENLKTDVGKKEQMIRNFAEANKEKQTTIIDLQSYIDDLKEDVDTSKQHADEIQHHLDALKEERSQLDSGDAYEEKDSKIQQLQSEVDSLKNNLEMLERELDLAKKTICHQQRKLRQADKDVTNSHIQFKDELASVEMKMRLEVSKVRDVMKLQWNEMKKLREQNEGMRCDMREIKDLLVTEALNANANANPNTTRPPQVSLPVLSRDNSRLLPNRKKK